MSHSSKPRSLTYAEATRAFAENDVREDINDACSRLSQAMSAMMERFGTVAKQIHTIDLQRISAPLKPKWDALSKEFGEILWLYRNNVGFISARLKLFCTSVLPVVARNMDGRSRRSYSESSQVLQTFMTISAEHAATTRTLLERALALMQQVTGFHTELAKFVTRQSSSGQKEIYDLSIKLSELEVQIRQICILNSELGRADVTHVTFSIFKIVNSSGRRPGRSKIPQQRMALSEELSNVSRAHQNVELKRNELAHAQYSAQIRIPSTDYLGVTQTTIAPLACEIMLSLESSFGLLLSIWARIKNDCAEIIQWLNAPMPVTLPSVLAGYQECGPALYVTLANALDNCIISIDAAVIAKVTSS